MISDDEKFAVLCIVILAAGSSALASSVWIGLKYGLLIGVVLFIIYLLFRLVCRLTPHVFLWAITRFKERPYLVSSGIAYVILFATADALFRVNGVVSLLIATAALRVFYALLVDVYAWLKK